MSYDAPPVRTDNFDLDAFRAHQLLVRDAVERMKPVHEQWKMLEAIVRTGTKVDRSLHDLAAILPFDVPTRVLAAVNLVLPHINIITASVVSRDPQLLVEPVTGSGDEDELNARLCQAALRHYWGRADATAVLKDMTWDMVVLGNGFCKTGWVTQIEEVDGDPKTSGVNVNEMLDAAAELATEENWDRVPDIDDLAAFVPLTEQRVAVDEPFVEYVSPYDVFVPVNARRMNSTAWVAQRLRLRIDQLRQHPFVTKPELIQPDSRYANDHTMLDAAKLTANASEFFTYATVFELYDYESKTVSAFQLDATEPLWVRTMSFSERRRPPFTHMRNYNDGGSQFWAYGDVEAMAPIQLMFNRTLSAEIDNFEKPTGKTFVNKKVYTDAVRAALKSAKDDELIPIDLPQGTNIEAVIQEYVRNPLPADTYNLEAKLQDWLQRVPGISDFQAGGMGADRMSGTAAAIVDGVATLRAQDKIAAVENAAAEIGMRIVHLVQENVDDGTILRVVGATGRTAWLQVSPADLMGDFRVKVEGGSTKAVNPATRAQRGLQTLNVVVPALTQLGHDPSRALRQALIDLGYDPDYILAAAPQDEAAEETADGDSPEEMLPEMPAGVTPEMLMGGAAPMEDGTDLLDPAAGAHPADLMALFGGPPLPAATGGDVAL